MKPSNLALIISGTIIFFVFLLLISEMMNQNKNLIGLNLIILLLILSVAIGVHGILHFMAEVTYKYNPVMDSSELTY
jgi:hypothetical protein